MTTWNGVRAGCLLGYFRFVINRRIVRCPRGLKSFREFSVGDDQAHKNHRDQEPAKKGCVVARPPRAAKLNRLPPDGKVDHRRDKEVDGE